MNVKKLKRQSRKALVAFIPVFFVYLIFSSNIRTMSCGVDSFKSMIYDVAQG